MKNFGLKVKLTIGFGVSALVMAVLAGFIYFGTSTLSSLQHEGASRAIDAYNAGRAANLGESGYSIIADAIINRDLKQTSQDWAEFKEKSEKELKSLESVVDTPEETKALGDAKEAFSELSRIFEEDLFPYLEQGGVENRVISHLDGAIDRQKVIIKDTLDYISRSMGEESAHADREFDSVSARTVKAGVILSIIGILIGIWIGFGITRSVSRAIQLVSSKLSAGSEKLAAAAEQIRLASTSLSASTREQASAIQQTASSTQEISAMVTKNSENAKLSGQAGETSREAALKGKQSIAQVMTAMDEISDTNAEMTDRIKAGNVRISEITQVIAEIATKTEVINDIVFQTKLLSFNALVEAARAGEHGKGFAVVAEEVGNLAQMSGNAAKEISTMLEGSIRSVEQIVKGSTSEVERMVEVGKLKVDDGKKTVKECGFVLDEIVEQVSGVSSIVRGIATASEEQSRGVGEISQAMSQLEETTRSNATATEQTAYAADSLTAEVHDLRDLVKTLEQVVYGAKKEAPRDQPTGLKDPSSDSSSQGKKKTPFAKVA